MKLYKTLIFSLFISVNSYAVEIPNQFEDGQVTSASQMNENFQALKAELEAQRALIEANLGNQKVIFQGFSTDSMNGGQGLIAMQQACHNFVPGSHICNITEFAESPYNPQAVESMTGSDWILSNFSVNDGNSNLIADKNGIARYYMSTSVSCHAWTDQSSGDEGTSINDKGDFTIQQCSNSFKVACCK